MTDTLVVDAPKTTATRKRVNQRSVLKVLENWQAGGLTFEEEVAITLYKGRGGKLRFEKGGAIVSLVILPGPTPSWKASYRGEQMKCLLLSVRLGTSEARVCLEYHLDGRFSHGTMTVLGSAGYTGNRHTTYSQPAGRMV